MSKFAVIETGGKQYKVSAGSRIKVEKLGAKEGGSTSLTAGANFTFDKILLRADGDRVEIGTPYVQGAKIEARVIGHGRGEKKIVFKYHPKTRYKKKKGHRQEFTDLQIVSM